MDAFNINKIIVDDAEYYLSPNINSVNYTSSTSANAFVGGITSTEYGIQVSYYNTLNTSGNITAANFTSTSDARLKNSIVDTLIDYNTILDHLQIKDFYFNSDETKSNKQIGLVAQQLEAIIPDEYKNCFIKKDDNGYYSINEIKLVYLALLKIKELEKRIKELEDTII